MEGIFPIFLYFYSNFCIISKLVSFFGVAFEIPKRALAFEFLVQNVEETIPRPIVSFYILLSNDKIKRLALSRTECSAS